MSYQTRLASQKESDPGSILIAEYYLKRFIWLDKESIFPDSVYSEFHSDSALPPRFLPSPYHALLRFCLQKSGLFESSNYHPHAFLGSHPPTPLPVCTVLTDLISNDSLLNRAVIREAF